MPHVLVADDDPLILRMLTDFLEQRGFGVDVANDGEEAYERALSRAPDVLITDIMMPKLDGWSLVRKLRLEPKLARLPVIFLTAVSTDDARVQAFRLGADDYVNKPFKFNDLIARIERVLGAHQPAADAGKRASSGLAGDLSQVGLSTLLVLVEMERKTGVLKLSAADGRSGEIAVRDGKIIDARLDARNEQTGAAAVYVMLTWSAGKFEFAVRNVGTADRIQRSTTQLLMEGARLMDEAKAPAADVQLDDDAISEWDEEQRTPMIVAAKLADLVRRTARVTTPPYGQPIVAPPADEPSAFDLPAIELVPEPLELAPIPPIAEAPQAVELRAPPEPVRAAAVDARPLEVPAPFRPRPSTWWLVGFILLGFGGVLTFAVKPTETSAADTELHNGAIRIGAAIDRGADIAQIRADGYAAMPLLRAGIETDAATLQDIITDETTLQPKAGEVIELFQHRGGKLVSVVRLPPTAREIPPQSRVETDGKSLQAVAAASIKTQQSAVGGAVSVAVTIDLTAIQTTLARHARGARIVGLARPLVLVAAVPGDTSPTVTVPIATKAAPGLALAANVTPPSPAARWPLLVRYVCFALAALLLLLYIALSVRARPQSVSPR